MNHLLDDNNNNREIELILDNNINNPQKEGCIISSISYLNSIEEKNANNYINNELSNKNESSIKKNNENYLIKDIIKNKKNTLNKIQKKIDHNHIKSVSFQDVNHLIPTTDEDKSGMKIENPNEFNDAFPKRKSAIYSKDIKEVPVLSQNNYTLRTKLFEQYLSDDEPSYLTPLRITKNKLEEIFTNKYFTTYNVNFTAPEEDRKIEDKLDLTPKDKDLGNNFTLVKRLVSDINSKNLSEMPEKPQSRGKENSQNKHELTLDRIAYDINKQHISFNRRRTDEALNGKSAYFRRNIMFFEKEKENIADQNIYRKFTTDYKKIINIDIDKKTSHPNLLKRVKIIVIVIESIFFLQKEMKLYGIRASKSDFNFLNVDDYVDMDLSKYSFCLKNNDHQSIIHKLTIPKYIITPGSLFDKIWKRVFFFNLLVFITIYPYRIGFYNDKYMTPQSIFFILDIVNELIFLSEIIVQCFMGYYDEDGNLELDLINIVYNYFCSWLLIDVVCLFPFDILRKNIKKNNLYGELLDTTKLVKFLRIFKFGMIINNIKFIDKFQEFIHLHQGFIKLIYFFINSIILCYTFACLWHFSAVVHYYNESWIKRFNFHNDAKWTLFLKSIYFGYTVFITVGYGDIVPFTSSYITLILVEIILVLLWMYICALFYTFSLTSLSNVFLESNANNLNVNNKCLIIEEVFRASKLTNLIQKTIFYLKRNQDKEQTYSYRLKDIRNLLSELPNSIKVEIARTMYNNSFQKIIIFRDLKSRSFIANIIPLLQSIQLLKDNVIYSVDEVPEKMYFIGVGSVCFTTYDNIVYQTLHEGSYFGEIEILRKTYRESNVLTKENCQLLTLTKKIVLNDILNNYYEFFQILLKNMVKRWNFFVDITNTIESIINEGKNLFDNELANIVKYRLKIGFDMSNFNKYYFGIGILNRLEQLKNKNNDNRIDYNLEAINHVFSSKEKIDEVLVKRKVSRKTKPHNKPSKINIADIEENIVDDKGKILISKNKSEKLIVKNKKYKQTVLKENKVRKE